MSPRKPSSPSVLYPDRLSYKVREKKCCEKSATPGCDHFFRFVFISFAGALLVLLRTTSGSQGHCSSHKFGVASFKPNSKYSAAAAMQSPPYTAHLETRSDVHPALDWCRIPRLCLVHWSMLASAAALGESTRALLMAWLRCCCCCTEACTAIHTRNNCRWKAMAMVLLEEQHVLGTSKALGCYL